jgi:hypothetical protein
MVIRIINISYKVIKIKYVKIVDAEILSVRRFRVYSDPYVFVSALKFMQEWQRKFILIFIVLLSVIISYSYRITSFDKY